MYEEDGIVYGENRSGMIKILEARHVYGGVLIVARNSTFTMLLPV